jgi:hypothetical protein
MTPLQFVTSQRITHAQQLIQETSRSLSRRSRSKSATPVRAGLPAGNVLTPERLPAAALKKGNVRKPCEFTARAAPGFAQGPDFLGVFASDISAGKLKKERGLTITLR